MMNELLLAVFLLTQVGDFITTKIALDRGGSEANPIVNAAMDKLGLIIGLVVAKSWVSVAMLYAYFFLNPYFLYLCSAGVMFYGFILINNIKVIRVLNGRV